MAKTEKVLLFNQCRLSKEGGVNRGWGDACEGHAEHYAAMECMDKMSGAWCGTRAPTSAGEAISALILMQYKDAGYALDLRIIKRVTTIEEEILETTEVGST